MVTAYKFNGQGDLETGSQAKPFDRSLTGHRGTDPTLFLAGEYQSYDQNSGKWKISGFSDKKWSSWKAGHGERWQRNIEKIDAQIDSMP